MPDALTEERLRWIHALESGNYHKGIGALRSSQAEDADTPGYCCIGVWCADSETPLIPPLDEGGEAIFAGVDVHWNRVDGYQFWRSAVQATPVLEDYLIAMNDGTPSLGDVRTGRQYHARRSHPFIARFLRKVWGLTDAG